MWYVEAKEYLDPETLQRQHVVPDFKTPTSVCISYLTGDLLVVQGQHVGVVHGNCHISKTRHDYI